MAPAGTPARKARGRGDQQFFDVGVQGRKTGITLQDKGIRDEYGMEPLDGIFSSPEKSPPKRPASGRRSGGTITTSESMEVQESSIAEPAHTIKSQNLLRNNKTYLPPPLARSPKKTNLGSSPRRHSSMGPRSVARRSMESPDRPAPHSTVNRRLDFSVTEEEPTNSTVTQRTPVVGSGRGNGEVAARPDIYDLQESPVRGQKRTYDQSIVEEETYANGETELDFNGLVEESLFPPAEDESLQFVQGADEDVDAYLDDSPSLPEPTPPPAKKSRLGKTSRVVARPAESGSGSGRKPKSAAGLRQSTRSSITQEPSPVPTQRNKTYLVQRPSKLKNNVPEPESEEEEEVTLDPSPPPAQSKKFAPVKRSGKANKKVPEPELEEDEAMDSVVEPESGLEQSSVDEEPNSMPPPKKARGRPQKNSKLDVHRDPAPASKEPVFKVPALPQKRGPKPKSVPSERDPNVRAGSVVASRQDRSTSKAASEAPTVTSTISRRPTIVRGLQMLREATPMEDAGTRTTRSGRASVKPVDFWRGETVKYDREKNNIEVVRAENRLESVHVKKRSGLKPKRRVKAEESDDEEELEPWEVDPGTLQGSVNLWDVELDIATKEVEDQTIAMAEGAYPTKEVEGGNFQFTKLLTIKDFFGAGIIEIPSGGFKRPRNSRKMQLVFFVLEGVAEVTVAEERFTIHKGGFWQVPRGNSYSIENTSQRTTRLFFSQANEKPTPTEP